MTEAQPAIPASVAAAWGLRDRPARGPKPALSLDRIVEAAVELADAEGLAAVSMGRVAKAAGVSTMALYRYVASKAELLALMVDHGLGPYAPSAPGSSWREAPRFPAVHRAVDGGAFDDDGDDEEFGAAELGFGLQRALDGIAALVKSRTPGT